MPWNYLQSCMYIFIEKYEINLTIWYTVTRFNPKLFTTSGKSNTFFQYRPEVTWPTTYISVAWFLFLKKDKYNIFRHGEILLDLLIFTLYLLQSVCCSKYSAKTTIFLSFIFFFISCIAFYRNICSEFFLLKYNLNSNFL